jgi:zinc D-Ala-D-Ala carboxypeptidase
MTTKSTFYILIGVALSLCLHSANAQGKPEITQALLLGKFDQASTAGFVVIDPKYTQKSGIYLQQEVYDAYKAMYEAAATEKITLPILSATRNFDHQKQIWERKWKAAAEKHKKLTQEQGLAIAREILQYSSMPGTSRHHWGTDIDLVSLEPSFFQTAEGKRIHAWLLENAPSFGFCQPYQDKANGRSGYEDEPWHWSYMPLATSYINAYSKMITYKDLNGFLGSEYASLAEVIQKYAMGIHQDCKPNDNK